MAPRLQTADSRMSILYRFMLDTGKEYQFLVSVVSPTQASNILHVSTDYVFVCPMKPKGQVALFLRGARLDRGYVANQTGLDPIAADFLATLLPLLTKFGLPDEMLSLAAQWDKQAVVL